MVCVGQRVGTGCGSGQSSQYTEVHGPANPSCNNAGEVCRQVDPRPVWRSTQRLRRHSQGKPLASLLTTNSGRGPGTAHFAATSTPDELTPPPPISTMRWRIAAPETVRCVDGKSSAMRCRMADMLRLSKSGVKH